MKVQRALVVLTVLNIALVIVTHLQLRRAEALDGGAVLRGRALELVDEAGRVRASIQVYPANPSVQLPDGTKGYPETVLLRLITRDGRPSVKLSASERGGILVLGGEAGPTYAQLKAELGSGALTLTGQGRRAKGRDAVTRPLLPPIPPSRVSTSRFLAADREVRVAVIGSGAPPPSSQPFSVRLT